MVNEQCNCPAARETTQQVSQTERKRGGGQWVGGRIEKSPWTFVFSTLGPLDYLASDGPATIDADGGRTDRPRR